MLDRAAWVAQEGPQTALITCPIFEIFYGGARGGGKTDGILGDFIRHADTYGEHAIGAMFRRERVQLMETIERSRAIYASMGCIFNEVEKQWRFPNGARLRFAYLERDADAEAYQGHSYTRVYVEEIGNFPSEAPVLKLMATLRSGSGVPVGFRATGNPGGPGHQWVKRRYIDPAPAGWTVIIDPVTTLKRIYIPSRVSDNSYLGPDYVQRLQASGSKELVRAWLEGDWNAIEGAFFSDWTAKNILEPFTVPEDWIRFRSGDWGYASPFSIGWWAVVQDDYDVHGVTLPRGAMVRYREWYGTRDPARPSEGLKLTGEEVGNTIAHKERDDPKMAYGVMDPSAFKVEGGPSIMERLNGRLIALGATPFREADNTRVTNSGARDRRGPISGWDAMRARIKGSKGRPMVYCFNTCTASIRTIPVLQHDPDRAEDLDTKAEDHAADDWRYASSSRPWRRFIPPPDPDKEAYRVTVDDLTRDIGASVKLL
jgi:Terminase large subunit, T4likevirus-type, N-terminal